MKLQAPTIVLVALAAALSIFVAVNELRSPNSSETDRRQVLFGFEEDGVQSLTVETPGQTLTFEKDEEQWHMRSPDKSLASESSVVFLLNLMASGKSDRTFEVDSTELADFGLIDPLAEVEVVLENDDTHRLVLGDYDFNRSAIYAQTLSSIATSNRSDDKGSQDHQKNEETEDSEDEETEDSEDEKLSGIVDVFVVSTSFDTAVNRPVEDWKEDVETEKTEEKEETGETEKKEETEGIENPEELEQEQEQE